MTSADAATATKPTTIQNSEPKTDEMVATIFSTATPPHSPRRTNGGRHSVSVTGQFMVNPSPVVNAPVDSKGSPKNRRASYHPESMSTPMSSSRRGSAHGESPSHSPVPLGSRLQPATATAPVVGRHHKKNNSLVGFDPLLSDAVFSAPSSQFDGHQSLSALMNLNHPPATPTTTTTVKDQVIPPSLSNLTLTPPRSPPRGHANSADADPAMSQELRKLAKDLSAASPQRPSSQKVSKPKSSKFHLTPPFRSSEKTAAANNSTATTNTKKKPWQRHRRTKSLEMPSTVSEVVTKRTDSFENDATKANNNFAPMMQDLYDVVKHQQIDTAASLALPTLYKPAPTSFLTGNEVVRSSEQDPSPFQMEIPSLDQTLVAARAVQFVNVYRKEDMNFDMQALVGTPRMSMRSFVETADSPAPNSQLTQAHRPIVESLLEAADDITVAGFFSTENAGSADARREAVVLERQMQCVVVFRGTTPEQTGKTGHFKKKDNVLEALSTDNTNSKVYASVKQAYMELEQKVFDCLDQFMDQNPFCDVVFTGSSFGGAMATLGAFRYATNRPVVRVCCQTFGAPKAGDMAFRQQVNSLPNLKVMRIEYGNDLKCSAPHDSHGAHVGHMILLSKNNDNKTLSAVACKFDNHDARKHHASKSAALLATFKKERDITSYVSHLEQLQQSKVNKWVKDFAGEDGTGVRGKDNEQRQVV